MRFGTFSPTREGRKDIRSMSLLADPLNDLGKMRYFTPELYLQINSSDDKLVERAQQRWEKAIVAYRKHVSAILTGMPSELRDLANISLHDWELTRIVRHHDTATPSGSADLPLWQSTAWIALRQGDELVVLSYVLWDKVQNVAAPKNWSFSKKRVHWLYDELDRVGGQCDRLIHRVLLSNGVTLGIPFSTCIVRRIKLQEVMPESELAELAR